VLIANARGGNIIGGCDWSADRIGTAEFSGILACHIIAAIGRMEAALDEEADFFLFSDDAAAAEQVLNFVPKSCLNHVHGDREVARWRRHVIANSSFSWCGAWPNRSPDKIVVAPRAWFARAELSKKDTSDLYPKVWLLV
jgi:hypothetical protein